MRARGKGPYNYFKPALVRRTAGPPAMLSAKSASWKKPEKLQGHLVCRFLCLSVAETMGNRCQKRDSFVVLCMPTFTLSRTDILENRRIF